MDRQSARARILIGGALALAAVVVALQVGFVRPYLWPAGAGVLVSPDDVFASLAVPQRVVRIRPPDVTAVAGLPVRVYLRPEGLPGGAPIRVETLGSAPVVSTIVPLSGPPIELRDGLPRDPAGVLRVWREAHRLGVRGAMTLHVRDASGERRVDLARQPVWNAPGETRQLWLRFHAGTTLQSAAFLAGALILLALGARGLTARLMTLALLTTAVANGGPLAGANHDVPVIGDLALLIVWMSTPLAFPIIGLAVLYFPSRAALLDRHHWIPAALAIVAAPMLLIGLLAAIYLLGADAALPALSWVAARGWIFDASFALALLANVLIVIQGAGRYRGNPDVTERRRIQIVVYTGVPAVLAYALLATGPLLAPLIGRPLALPWPIEAALQLLVLLPAVALPYAVAVKRVFSPRTVVRRGLQYALARRTLSLLIVLPAAALVFAVAGDRDRPLADVVLSHPVFYTVSLALAALAFRFRDRAQRWLDRRFFRAEYDAREILLSLANRVPHEPDPATLLSLVLRDVDSALQPESIAVLASDEGSLEVVVASRAEPRPLGRDSALASMLHWSDEPLEVFLDDDRSPARRLPAADRDWLAAAGAALLVPLLGGTADGRSLTGVIVLGRKRSEEPYTGEDRRLLSAIAGQMRVALDLSRLRRELSTGGGGVAAPSETGRATRSRAAAERSTAVEAAWAPAGVCAACQRCYDLLQVQGGDRVARCPDDGSPLQPLPGIPAVIEGKYRVEAVVGRGGMGAVFRARDLRLDRDVAIKTVNAALVQDPAARARFQREAQILARLQHPALVMVFDYGTLPSNAAFLVMELIPGEDLRRVLAREQRLPVERTLALVGDIASGIDAAHRAGILHRDLKPENILLPAGGGPKVVDFGVAKVLDPPGADANGVVTYAGTLVGTPAYMSPEQLRGEPLDVRTDVYSLAVMTYEMLTGRLPFGVGSFLDVGLRQAASPVPLDAGDMPAGMAEPLRRALAISRDERPASAGDFIAALRLRTAWPPAR